MSPWMTEYRQRAAVESDISHYLPVLFGSVARYAGARVIEIGVRGGNSTVALLAAAELAGGHVWSIDIDTGCEFRSYPDPPDPSLWTFIGAGSESWRAVQGTPEQVDVLFIDASHEYNDTCNELDLYLPKVRPGGTVLMHDTAPFTSHTGWVCRVRDALESTLPAWGLTWDEYGGTCGLGVIAIPDRRPRLPMPPDPEADPLP